MAASPIHVTSGATRRGNTPRGWRRGLAALGLGLAVLAPWTPAAALDSQDCRPKPLNDAARATSTAMASRVAAALDARGARLALVARVGRNMQDFGLRFSHVGFVTRSGPGAPWQVVHLLNICGTSRSALHEQTLEEFFQDSPFNYESLIALPPPAWQDYLAPRLADAPLREATFTPRYSAIAYPFGTGYQNSNGWVLEWLAAREAEAAGDQGAAAPPTRRLAQASLRRHGYVPGRIPVNRVERLEANLTIANVAFLDHPLAERLSGKYSVVTVESILAYGCRRGWLARLVALAAAGGDTETSCTGFDFPPATDSTATPDATPAVLLPSPPASNQP